MMQIAPDTVVTIGYTLKDDSGNIIDSTEEGGAFSYLQGAGNILPTLEDALAGKSAGDELAVSIPAENGYGLRDESIMDTVSREMFASVDEVEVGMRFRSESPDGETMVFTVVSVADDEITVDGNHPLAGVNLNFEVKVMDVRNATDEEMAHGHVHG